MKRLGTPARKHKVPRLARDDRVLENYWRIPHMSESEKGGEPGT